MESSEAKAPYKIDPLSVAKVLQNVPYKDMKFITVKDNSHKLVKIGKCYDYLRRFSQRIWIVKSPKGGIHFHALVQLKHGKKVSYKKGIHIQVDDVGGARPLWDPEAREDKLIEAEELFVEAFDATGDVKHAQEVYAQVLAPPSKQYQRACRAIAKSKKVTHITNIVSYLNKNLHENLGVTVVDNRLMMYEHYIIKAD